MRNREAARYARWAAIAAGLAALAVVGVYVQRSVSRARALRLGPAAVPATVAQQSDQFSFSKVDQNRTLFTVRASHLTQYKDQNRALLQDVWITLYGRDGSRNDNIHTRECSYGLDSGVVHCQGSVEIDVDAAKPAPGHGAPASASAGAIQVKTSDLSFDRDKGEASTLAPVQFTFPGGQGRGVGVTYRTSDSIVRVENAVEFDLAASPKTGNLPVSATGSSLEINRDDRQVIFAGPVDVREGSRELTAEKITVGLDANDRARDVVADGQPQIHALDARGKIDVSAARFESFLNSAGQVDRVVAQGAVKGAREASGGTDRFSADHVEFAMLPGQNLIRDMTATGDVVAESRQGADSRVLKTAALRVKFGAAPASKAASGAEAERQHIEEVETLAPATIDSHSGDAATTLAAKQFVAEIAGGRRLEKLFGHSGVEVRSQTGSAAPQLISAAEMAVTFGAGGDWDVLDETGNVHFQQADRSATAAHARIVRSTDTITLEGSPVISDAVSRTTASSASINQKTGDLRLSGGVVSTYLPATDSHGQSDAVGFGAGAAHISADTLIGSVSSGHVVYSGNARLWQGESVLDADQIELWRDDKKLQATGHVVAVFPQAAGPFATPFGEAAGARKAAAKAVDSKASAPTPTLWKVVAPSLTYWADQGKAHLEGGVTASSDQGTLQSHTLDVFLGPAAPGAPKMAGPAGIPAPAAGRQLSRVLAQGDVVVRQGDRRGAAQQGEYTAADGKFVLSGGQPTVSDSSSNTATGRSLTFFVANDTILIDSQEGSRTLTKHRVEK
ncbi:MAG TPA: LptA/OstA family protein [Candidatus Acidoferrales bacterium]|nr:LptA/OstA family protein [Candidatus Acidoferrales bacterium]